MQNVGLDFSAIYIYICLYTCFDAMYVDLEKSTITVYGDIIKIGFTEAGCFSQTIQNVGLDFYVIYVNVTCQ